MKFFTKWHLGNSVCELIPKKIEDERGFFSETYQKSSGNRFSSRTSFSDSVDFIGWYANETNHKLNIEKSDVLNQYLAYHQGHNGYKRGNYKQKPNLIKAAKRTEKNAIKFDLQLKNCL